MCQDSIVIVKIIIDGGPDLSWKKGREYWKGRPTRKFLGQTLVQYPEHCMFLQMCSFNWMRTKKRGGNKILKRETQKNKTYQTWSRKSKILRTKLDLSTLITTIKTFKDSSLPSHSSYPHQASKSKTSKKPKKTRRKSWISSRISPTYTKANQ